MMPKLTDFMFFHERLVTVWNRYLRNWVFPKLDCLKLAEAEARGCV